MLQPMICGASFKSNQRKPYYSLRRGPRPFLALLIFGDARLRRSSAGLLLALSGQWAYDPQEHLDTQPKSYLNRIKQVCTVLSDAFTGCDKCAPGQGSLPS